MKINQILDGKPRAATVAIPAVIILLPLAYSVVSCAFPQGSEPFLEMPDKKVHASCVKDTTYMRFRHMDLLKEIRDEAVRGGKRGKIGLDNCRECHPNRQRFCNECHDAVNLRLDCFGCHYFPERAPTDDS